MRIRVGFITDVHGINVPVYNTDRVTICPVCGQKAVALESEWQYSDVNFRCDKCKFTYNVKNNLQED